MKQILTYNRNDLSKITFALLDKQNGIVDLPPTSDEEYPLPTWYRSIREIPLDKLEVEDICKSCRQQLHLEFIVPMSLDRLASDPLIGEMYDGELVVSMKYIPQSYWANHVDEAKITKSIVEKILLREDIDSDVRLVAKELLETLAT